jgi:hypothetical protein
MKFFTSLITSFAIDEKVKKIIQNNKVEIIPMKLNADHTLEVPIELFVSSQSAISVTFGTDFR